MDGINEEDNTTPPEVHQQPTPPPSDSHVPGSAETRIADFHGKRMDIDEEATAPDMLSPMSADGEKQEEHELPARTTSTDLGSPSMGYDFSNIRVRLISKHIKVVTFCTNQLHS